MGTQRINISLDAEHAAKLTRLAARVHVNEGTLARSLLASALDDADPDPTNITALLDSIDGAFEQARLGGQQIARGEGIPLARL
ncbi:MAG: hypothetical protein EA388_04990 [Nitriliruptor sp.]|nr:MAG: hypothetical protein EA388_04990 [Nitriliruptor sp.]